MDLPTGKKIVRVEYTFDDGEKYYLTETEAEKIPRNERKVSDLNLRQKYIMEKLVWTKVEDQ